MEGDISVETKLGTLWLTEISHATYQDQGLSLGGDGGLFLALEDGDRFDVLCKVPNAAAGLALMSLISCSENPKT